MIIDTGIVVAQNQITGDGFGTGWPPGNILGLVPSAGTSQIITRNPSGTGNRYFRMLSGGLQQSPSAGCFFGDDLDISANGNTVITAANTNCANGAYYINTPNITDNYVFKTPAAAGSQFVYFRIQGAVQTPNTHTAPTSANVAPGLTQRLTVAMSGVFSTGQGAYIRYHTGGNFTANGLVAALTYSGSGNDYYFDMPASANTPGKTIFYYFFTSGAGLTIANTNADFYTINLLNNGGTNYNYTVSGQWTSVLPGLWSTAATWNFNRVPPLAESMGSVLINTSVTLDQDAIVSKLTINPTFTFTASDASPRTLTISIGADATSLANSGIWANGAGGSNILFSSTGVNIVHTIAGTYAFNNVRIARTTGTPTIGLTFSNTSTINNNFQLDLGGYVLTTGPKYGPSSTLIYNDGQTYFAGPEWTSNATSGQAGYPINVQIGITAPFSGLNLGSGTYNMGGNFTFSGAVAGTKLSMSTSVLNILGNWVNNSSPAAANFTRGFGTVTFNGNTAQSIGGTNTNIGGYAFNNLIINNSSGLATGVTLDKPITVAGIFTLTNGVVNTSTNSLTVTNTINTAIAGGSVSTYVNGPLIRNIASSPGTNYVFPVGVASNYQPFTLNAPTGLSPVITVQAFTPGVTGSADGVSLISLSTTEYWLATLTSGSYTGGNISLGRQAALGSLNGIGRSAALSGSYVSLAGSVSGNNIINSSNTTSLGYFTMAVVLPLPVITSFTSNNPATTQSGYVGSVLTINGSNFTGATDVTIGGVAASILSNSGTVITAAVNLGASGNVTVTIPSGSGSLAGFTFLGYISTNNSDWNTPTTWLGGTVPPAGAATTIANAVTVNAPVANTPLSIIINAAGNLNIGGAGTITSTTITNTGNLAFGGAGAITIANSGTITNSNTFTAGSGTVNFAGSGTVVGSITFGNLTVNGAVALSNAVSVSGNLLINTNGSITANAPFYTNTSTLIYNTTTNPINVSTEWTNNGTVSGAGIPQNITIQNTNVVALPNTNRGLAGNLLITGGGITLNISSGDLFIGGNLTRLTTGFTNNGRAVFFNGAATQTVTVSGGGTAFFDVLIIDKPSNNLVINNSPATDIVINTAGGSPLQLNNVGQLDLNGRTLTMNNTNGNIAVNAANRTITSGVSGGVLAITGNKSVVGAGTLIIDTEVTVRLTASMDFGASKTTINGILQLNGGGAVNTNAPTYGAASTLIYNIGAAYGIFNEWTAGVTTGSGVPNNVQLGLDAAGSGLTIGAGNYTMNGTLTFDAANSGTLTLGSGILSIGGNWVNNRIAANFNNGGGTVAFIGSTVNTIGGANTNAVGFAFNNLTINKTSPGSVTLNKAITIANALTVNGSGIFSLNGVSLSIITLTGTSTSSIINNTHGSTNITLTVTNAGSFLGALQNGGAGTLALVKSGAGILTLGALSGVPNSYSGNTTVAAGTLDISGAGGMSANSNYTFNGGNLIIGALPNASVLNAGTLNILANTSITLNGPNAYNLNFAASNGVAWDLTKTVTIFNWTPSAGRIINVATGSGLTSGQLARINFDTYGVGAKIVGIEVRPAFLYVTNGTGGGNFNAALNASWLFADKPTLNNGTESIYIQPGDNLNLDVASPFVFNFLRIEIGLGATVTMGNHIVTVFPTGDFRIAGTVSMTSQSVINMSADINMIATSASANFTPLGTLNFLGAFTITSNTPNKVILPNVNLSASVNFGDNSIIGTGAALYMNFGGFVDTKPASYSTGSTLIYNTGAIYGRSLEWSTATGNGYPFNVTIQNGTTLDLSANGDADRTCAGTLTLGGGNGSGTISMGNMTSDLIVKGNVVMGGVNTGTLTLSTVFGADIFVGGNWTRYANGTFDHRSRAVFFNGSTGNDQTVTVNGGGTESFPYLIINKSDIKNVVLATGTNVNVFGGNGLGFNDIFEMINGGLDLNQQTFTFTIYFNSALNGFKIDGTAGNLNRQVISTGGPGTFAFNHADGSVRFTTIQRKTANLSTITFNPGVIVTIQGVTANSGVDFGNTITTISGTLRLNTRGYVTNNPPTYSGSTSLLQYNSGGIYNRTVEWNAGSGAGYPVNVQVSNSTTMYPGGTANTGLVLNTSGNLLIDASSSFDCSSAGTLNMTVPFNVGGNLTIDGTLTLSANAAGLLNVGGNWSRTGTFNQNNRNVNFNGSGDGILTASGGQTFSYMTLNKTGSGRLTISEHVAITDSIGLKSGKLTLNNKGISIVSTATKTAMVGVSGMDRTDITYAGAEGYFFVQRYLPARRSWRLVTAPFDVTGSRSIGEAWQERTSPLLGLDYSTPAATTASQGADSISANFGTMITGGTTANGFDQSPTNNSGVKSYLAGAWVTPANINSTAVNSKEGWMLFVRGDRKNFGQITTQFKTPTITTLRPRGQIYLGNKTINSTGVTVVGNPYAAAVDYTTLTKGGALAGTNTYTMWDPYLGGAFGAGAFVTLTWTGAAFAKSIPASTIDPRYIPSGAAIMVDFGAAGALTFKESDKNGNNTTTAFRPSPVSMLQTTLKTVESDTSSYITDGNLVLFDKNFSNDIDGGDAIKVGNFTENFSIKRNNKTLAVERMNFQRGTDTIFYNLQSMRLKNYRFEVNMVNVRPKEGSAAFFEDVYLNKVVPVALNTPFKYDFTIINDTGSYAPGRFRLLFVPSVRFQSEKAYKSNANNVIEWKVRNEYNLSYYEVERSTNGINFTVMTRINCGPDNASSVNYSWVDIAPGRTTYFYRIKSVSKFNVVVYSDVMRLFRMKPAPDKEEMYVFPNPVTGKVINLHISGKQAGVYQIRLMNSGGQMILNNMINHAGGVVTETIRANNTLVSGLYHLEITGPDKSKTIIKVVVD